MEAIAELELAQFKVTHDPGSNGPDSYHIYQLVNGEWTNLSFVQKFAFEISIADPVGRVTLELVDISKMKHQVEEVDKSE